MATRSRTLECSSSSFFDLSYEHNPRYAFFYTVPHCRGNYAVIEDISEEGTNQTELTSDQE